jgi:hypothetical protein
LLDRYMPTSRQYRLYNPVREQIIISTAPTFVERKCLDWDWKKKLVGQVVTPFDPMEEPEAVVEIENDSEEQGVSRNARPEAEPTEGQNLEGDNSEDDRDQDSDQGSIVEQDQEPGGLAEPEQEELIDPEQEDDRAAPPPEPPRAAGPRSSRR